MSYYIYLVNESRKCVQVPPHKEGPIRMFGPVSTMADVLIPANYNKVYHEVTGHSAREMLDGRQGRVTIPILKKVVEVCGTVRHRNYWKPTHGNAGAAAALMLAWALLHPEAMWKVSS